MPTQNEERQREICCEGHRIAGYQECRKQEALERAKQAPPSIIDSYLDGSDANFPKYWI